MVLVPSSKCLGVCVIMPLLYGKIGKIELIFFLLLKILFLRAELSEKKSFSLYSPFHHCFIRKYCYANFVFFF